MIAVSLVIPCYNEEAVLEETTMRLLDVFANLQDAGKISSNSRICYVDDGSQDKTWVLIEGLSRQYPPVMGIKLAHNQGHQNALLAGLLNAPGEVVISMDADLQDDIGAVERMLDEYAKGYEIVYGVRNDRTTDTVFKRSTAQLFYRLMRFSGAEIVDNHADYRLMGRQAIEALRQFKEVNLFLRGMVPLIGFSSTVVYYKRGERFAGESKYPFRKMLAFAIDGITSFSVTPLRLITLFGSVVFLASLAMVVYILATKVFGDVVVPGWASTVLPIYLLGGVQIFFLGIIGEYIGKIYKETKARPRFLIEKKTRDI